jgi:hypothetical protein
MSHLNATQQTLYISTRKLIPQFLFKKRPKAFCDMLSIRNIAYTRKISSQCRKWRGCWR